jgi:predicted transglutaminase-like cysteine proteinase
MPDTRAAADTPSGFISFCMRFADQCERKPSVTAFVALDGQTWKTLSRINRKVNDSIWPEDDQKHYGRAEYWTIPTDGYGDCDDYAVTKRKELLNAGFPASALRLAVVYSPRTERHAVLTVATDKGDLVLDNMAETIVSWNATGYTWIERQAATDPMRWVSLRPSLVADDTNLTTAAVSLAKSQDTPTSAIAAPAEPPTKTVVDGKTRVTSAQ